MGTSSDLNLRIFHCFRMGVRPLTVRYPMLGPRCTRGWISTTVGVSRHRSSPEKRCKVEVSPWVMAPFLAPGPGTWNKPIFVVVSVGWWSKSLHKKNGCFTKMFGVPGSFIGSWNLAIFPLPKAWIWSWKCWRENIYWNFQQILLITFSRFCSDGCKND